MVFLGCSRGGWRQDPSVLFPVTLSLQDSCVVRVAVYRGAGAAELCDLGV